MRIFTFITAHGGEHDIDLAAVRDICAPSSGQNWTVEVGSSQGCINVTPETGAALRAAWRAYHGQDALRPASGLPSGWYTTSDGGVRGPDGVVVRMENGELLVASRRLPVEVVEAVITSWRVRGGGAP